MKTTKTPNIRLSQDIEPTRYKLFLKPNLETFLFTGEETITIILHKPTKTIILHSVDLKIKNVVWRDANNTVQKGTVSYDKKTETAIFTFSKPLATGVGELSLSFSGVLGENLRGFYRSKYTVNGEEFYMATTQFESTDARRAFPSFDEPAFKAIFDVTLQIPPLTTAISNTLETDIIEHEGGYKVVNFAPTPKMSTYLLAFVVGQFEYIEKKTKKGVIVRVFTTPGKKKQGEFALDVAVRCLEFYEDYFAIAYPLPVLDLIAVPDFAAGAMENWGAVTYRETAILVDDVHSSAANKQWVALVVAHELAHMWFGDLVTMEWWTHLWLNEGFASYIEYLAVDELFPEWDMWTQFVQLDHAGALSLDGLKNTHAIEIDVHHPDEISEIFDAVSYAKGASVIRMLAAYLGKNDFRDGLRTYLKEHSYANAATVDLWAAFEEVSGKPVRSMMQNWTRKPGYPFIRIKEKGKDLQLTQQRYFSSSVAAREEKDTTVWSIPFSVVTKKENESATYFMDAKSLHIPKPEGESWMKLNKEETSFIRVDYPTSFLQKLANPIAEKKLSAVDRFGIIRDAFDLSQTGYLPTSEALSLVAHYKDEDNYIVWSEIASQLGSIKNLISDKPYFDQFLVFAEKLFTPIAHHMGWEKKKGEPHTHILLRSLALFSSGFYGNKEIIKKAQTMFEKLQKDKTPIEADIRSVVYNLVAKNGGEKEYSLFEQMYHKEPMQEEKERLSKALCFFSDKKLLQKALKFSFSDAVRLQDSFIMVTYVWMNPKGKVLAWEFVQQHWDDILRKYGAGGHLLPRFISPAKVFSSKEKAAEVRAFFKAHKAPGAQRTVEQVIEKIYANHEWLSKDEQGIKQFLHV
ncbi:MAG: M1 family metallopeptidase [Candidatus Levybacteria bacterium]|nr:M1 family metallopeptidase [Candidatus Levybacteria bacterium]